MQYAYELLQQAGARYNITNIGYHAIDSQRLEKRYLAWGADITPDYNPYEAGLQFLIDWNKGGFVGDDALAQTTSGNFGYSIGKSLVLGYLPVECLGQNDFAIEAFGRSSPASLVKGAAFDPDRKKILC